MQSGIINNQGYLKGGLLQKIYETTLTSTASSLTISGLDGDTDILYELIIYIVNGQGTAGTCRYYLRMNGDTGSNMGTQSTYGYGASPGSAGYTGTYWYTTRTAATVGSVGLSRSLIYAKSGYVRTILTEGLLDVIGTGILMNILFTESWNNTADNITSMVITAELTNGLGIGSHIELWALRKHS